MCKACKMDPRDVDIFYRRQGMVDADDFNEEGLLRYRHPKRRKARKDKYPKPRPGCPENDWGKHVYVWVDQAGIYESPSFYRYYGYYKYKYEVCCGCGKVGKKEHTDKYERVNMKAYNKRFGGNEFNVERGKPLDWRTRRAYSPKYRWFSFENDDQDFKAAHKQWAIQNGTPTWYYS
jgi:hypothetical protein